MKNLLKWCLMLTFLIAMTLACSIGADAAYEPDGTSSTEYLFDAAECNRTLVLNFVDENGNLIKQVNFQTKRGEEDVAGATVYGYDIVKFESDQGLWETCKITWCSGTGLGTYAYVQIRYKFISGLSQSVMTATATLRRSEAITLVERHYQQVRQQSSGYSYYKLHASFSKVVDYYTDVSTGAKNYRGYTLKNGYASNISGLLSYSWLNKMYLNIPSENFEYDYVNTTWSDDMGEYTKYDESKDGKMDYCINRVYYIDYYYDLNQYTVCFSANGGSGSVPEDITLYYGFTVTIPDTVPTRSGYSFLGWSPSSSASRATHQAGDSYTVSSDITFYAVWDKDDYEFSISNLAVTNGNIYANSVIQVNVRTDSWDDDQAYTGIPVELYYDERLIATQYVDFAIYGITWVTFEIDVGTVTGGHEIMVWINRERWIWEVDKTNNTVTTVINVLPEEYAFEITSIESNAPYKEDTTVMTSYLIYNDGVQNVYPDMEMPVSFTAYYLNSDGERVVIDTQTWENYVIPKTATNLVYFKWTVPDGLAGVTVYCECTVNADGNIGEINRENNTATLSAVIAERVYSQTPNPSFAAQKPDDYTEADLPAESIGSASWSMWVYEDESFYLKEFGIRIADNVPILTPGTACETAVYENGIWNLKSGYGVTMYYTPDTVSADGCIYPTADAITPLQTVTVYFPEYGYSAESGEFRNLEYVRGIWRFRENAQAENGERIHYIPVWIEDGEYTGSVIVEDFWTPAGMISCVRLTLPVIIEGTVFDDYYVGV